MKVKAEESGLSRREVVRSAFAVPFLFPAALQADPAARGWRIVGPGGGGAQYRPAISPHGGRQVLVACDMTGSYLSDDGGSTWRMFNLRGVSQVFAFDPLDARVLYAATIGLWRSADGGRKWVLVYPHPSRVSGVSMAPDHADEDLLVDGRPAPLVTALAVDPGDSKRLYAAFSDRGKASFRASADGGESWSEGENLPSEARAIHVEPRSKTVYVVGANQVSRMAAGGWRHGGPLAGVEAFERASMGFAAGNGEPVVYAVAGNRVYVSLDGGDSWEERVLPGKPLRVQAVGTGARSAEVAYVSYAGLREGSEVYFGVARSGDFGRTWALVWKQSNKPVANVQDAWITPRLGAEWPESPLDIGVSPLDANIAFACDLGRTMRTTDGGKSWKAVYSKPAKGGGWQSTGLDVTTTYGIHFDPFEKRHVFASTTDIGLFGSTDGGLSWKSASHGAPRSWLNTTYWMVFDPEVKGRAWAVMSGTHDLPRPKMWRRRPPRRFRGGVMVSSDGGWNWKPSSGGMPEAAVTDILLDAGSPREARVLYVAAFGHGVFQSRDGGRTWARRNNGIAGDEPFAWRLTMAPDGALYLVVARRSEDGSIGTPYDGAIYRSRDGAESWTRVALPEGVNGPNGLQVDPRDPSRLYLAAWARRSGRHGDGGGIFLSEDAGKSWTQVLDRDRHVYDVTIHPGKPSVVYACGFESSAWRSTDAGVNWKRIPGFNFKWGHRVVPDPNRDGFVYITTFGGGVWHGPEEGDAADSEDIATEMVAPGG